MRWLIVCFLSLFASVSEAAVPTATAHRLAREMEKGALAEKVDETLDRILAVAVWKLKREGYDLPAEKIAEEWAFHFKGYLARNQAIGDHAPMSMWLAEVCLTLKLLLGDYTYKALHLDDIETINFGLPVTMNPYKDEQWCKETQELSCRLDYELHAVPVMGVCAYWLTWIGCTAGTWGMGAVTMICTPLSMVAEEAMVTFFAPDVAHRIWDRRNK